MVNDLMMIC